jgi:serine/threonine-protein kinase
LLTGRLPFEADSPTQVVMMHMTIPVPDPRQVAPERNIPEPLVQVVNKALSKDAKKRYQDAIEFQDALKSALALAESVPPEQRFSMPPSLGVLLACPACGHQVPSAKFCLECGVRLPARSAMPENHTHPALPLPLVARDDDVSWLEDRRQQVRGALLGARLVGEQGAGKTRLLTELLTRASADGDFIAVTGPDPHHAEVAGYALRTAIEALAGLSEIEITELAFEDASPVQRALRTCRVCARVSSVKKNEPGAFVKRRSARMRTGLRGLDDVAAYLGTLNLQFAQPLLPSHSSPNAACTLPSPQIGAVLQALVHTLSP